MTLERLDVQARKNKCRVFHTENQGLPATRNYGIERAGGEYICCLDADDKYHPKFLSECVKRLDQEPMLGFVTTTVKVFEREDAYWYCSDYDPVRLLVENIVHVASLFRKSCWAEVGGYATNLSGFQDWNFWIAIVARGYRWGLVKRPLFLYRNREGSMIQSSEAKRAQLKRTIVENNLDFFKKHLLNVLDYYEKRERDLQLKSQAREKEVAKTALDKLHNLFQAHQHLKLQHHELIKDFQKLRK